MISLPGKSNGKVKKVHDKYFALSIVMFSTLFQFVYLTGFFLVKLLPSMW